MKANEVPTLVEDEVRTEIIFPFFKNAPFEPLIYVEVGTFVGGNICRVGEYAKTLSKVVKIYGIDDFHFVNISDPGFKDTGVTQHGQYNTFKEDFLAKATQNIEECGLGSIITLVNLDSIEATQYFQDRSIHILFLDGNHSYQYVAPELKAWIPKVHPEGCLLGHDWPCDGIQKAVRENFTDDEIFITSTNGGYRTGKNYADNNS